MRSGFLAAAIALASLNAGCQSLAPPNWCDPGSPEYQRSSAQRFDPFPETDVGPDVMGGRPREFDTPVAEPSRARWNPRTWAHRYGY